MPVVMITEDPDAVAEYSSLSTGVYVISPQVLADGRFQHYCSASLEGRTPLCVSSLRHSVSIFNYLHFALAVSLEGQCFVRGMKLNNSFVKHGGGGGYKIKAQKTICVLHGGDPAEAACFLLEWHCNCLIAFCFRTLGVPAELLARRAGGTGAVLLYRPGAPGAGERGPAARVPRAPAG